jgi:O-methyltransferase
MSASLGGIVMIKPDSSVTKQLVSEYGIKLDIINGTLFSHLGINAARTTALKNSVQLIYDNNIVGAVAELGVFQGEFAKQINELFFDRTLYLFDTFEGFTDSDVEKEKEIGTKIFERLSPATNFSGTSIELVMNKMKNPEKCVVKKGYFPETAKGLEDKFAFVSLDADLYQPMLEGLKYFYPKLSTGGFIFVHDFFNDLYPGTRKAVLEYKKDMGLKFVPLGDESSVVIMK